MTEFKYSSAAKASLTREPQFCSGKLMALQLCAERTKVVSSPTVRTQASWAARCLLHSPRTLSYLAHCSERRALRLR